MANERIYYSVDPEAAGEESAENQKSLLKFLQSRGYTVYRAPYVFSEDPEVYLQRELGLENPPSPTQQREAHIRWIDDANILLADMSAPSEGRAMIIQRALDKEHMSLPQTMIILIKNAKIERKFGKIIQGLIDSGRVVYFEYKTIEEVLEKWDKLVTQATEALK